MHICQPFKSAEQQRGGYEWGWPHKNGSLQPEQHNLTSSNLLAIFKRKLHQHKCLKQITKSFWTWAWNILYQGEFYICIKIIYFMVWMWMTKNLIWYKSLELVDVRWNLKRSLNLLDNCNSAGGPSCDVRMANCSPNACLMQHHLPTIELLTKCFSLHLNRPSRWILFVRFIFEYHALVAFSKENSGGLSWRLSHV